MDLEDQGIVMGGLQRDRINQQLQYLQNLEAEKATAAERILSFQEFGDALLSDKLVGVATKPITIAYNEIALREKVEDFVQFSPAIPDYHPLLFDSSVVQNVKDLCGSSIELRKELLAAQEKFRTFHDSISLDLVGTFIECLDLLRGQIQKEEFSKKLASYLSNSTDQGPFQASTEWQSVMSEIDEKFNALGFCGDGAEYAAEMGVEPSPLLPLATLTGFPIDYKDSTKEFVISAEFMADQMPLFEFKWEGKLAHLNGKGTLIAIDPLSEDAWLSASEVTRVGRCFFPELETGVKEGERFFAVNYLFGWGFDEAANAEPNQKNKQESDSSCFIATAVYEDVQHPQLVKLRSFRDEHLMASGLGRIFVRFYYAVGPTLALIPARLPSVKRLLRAVLDRF